MLSKSKNPHKIPVPTIYLPNMPITARCLKNIVNKKSAADSRRFPSTPYCISCTSLPVFHLNTWYVMKKGLDHEACDRSLQAPCSTLLYPCSTCPFLTLNFYIYSHPDTWYVMEKGLDYEGCGKSPDSPCESLLYLLQQVNRTHLSPHKELRIVTDKSLTIDKQAAVSTIICNVVCACARTKLERLRQSQYHLVQTFMHNLPSTDLHWEI